tara:strand:- start:742 stop:852 length:111 start_codon:yes stop_codon:yes gene_type:complete
MEELNKISNNKYGKTWEECSDEEKRHVIFDAVGFIT